MTMFDRHKYLETVSERDKDWLRRNGFKMYLPQWELGQDAKHVDILVILFPSSSKREKGTCIFEFVIDDFRISFDGEGNTAEEAYMDARRKAEAFRLDSSTLMAKIGNLEKDKFEKKGEQQ